MRRRNLYIPSSESEEKEEDEKVEEPAPPRPPLPLLSQPIAVQEKIWQHVFEFVNRWAIDPFYLYNRRPALLVLAHVCKLFRVRVLLTLSSQSTPANVSTASNRSPNLQQPARSVLAEHLPSLRRPRRRPQPRPAHPGSIPKQPPRRQTPSRHRQNLAVHAQPRSLGCRGALAQRQHPRQSHIAVVLVHHHSAHRAGHWYD